MKYKINEIFKSIQGEGFNLGKEVVFIRLAGCNLDCRWCDTNTESYEEISVEEMFQRLGCFETRSVILTGGEPTVQDIEPLLKELKRRGYWVGIETNGTNSLDGLSYWIDYIAMSPKSKFNQFVADEVRIVNSQLSLDDLLYVEKNIVATTYYISPLEINGGFNYGETLNLLSQINVVGGKKWHISLQMHKLAGIR